MNDEPIACKDCGTMLPPRVHSAGNALYDHGSVFSGAHLSDIIEAGLRELPAKIRRYEREGITTLPTPVSEVRDAVVTWFYNSQIGPEFDHADLAAAVEHWGALDSFYDSKCHRIINERADAEANVTSA